MELEELVELYMLPEAAAYNVLSWDTGSNAGTPISWEHAGIKECDTYLQREFGTMYCRTGSVVITIHGSPTHSVLGKTVEPARWKITLMGARAGIFYVSIDCVCLSNELPAPLDLLTQAATKTDHGFTVKSLRSCGDAMDSSQLFQITSLRMQPAFARATWSCGSAGCGVDFVLTSTPQDAEKLMASGCR
ncbi:MAG: hypothetical protein WB662_17555 [Methyloceanibacter sp.]